MQGLGRRPWWYAIGALSVSIVVPSCGADGADSARDGGAVQFGAQAADVDTGPGGSGRRLALVVGNDAYSSQPVLKNAVNDARTVAAALEAVGFAVETVEDATRGRLTAALGAFAGAVRDDDVALFYFAGHGVQVDEVNYLLPTDYAGSTADQLRLDAVSAVDVQELLLEARVAMLVLDACRDNPYGGSRSVGAGLAPMEPRGTLIAYAAGAGEVAADALAPGAGNGLFTAKFVEALEEPGLAAAELFRRVRQEVYAASNEEQFPAVYDGLLVDFVFRAPVDVADAGGDEPGDDSADETTAATLQVEMAFWESIRESTNSADFEAYKRRFPRGNFLELADNRLAALRAAPVSDLPPTPRPPVRDAGSPAAVEAVLGLDRAARQLAQLGLRQQGHSPGAADGVFGAGTRAAIRRWQEAQGVAATGYLDAADADALRAAGEAEVLREEAAIRQAAREGEARRRGEAERQAAREGEARRRGEAERQAAREAEAERQRRVFVRDPERPSYSVGNPSLPAEDFVQLAERCSGRVTFVDAAEHADFVIEFMRDDGWFLPTHQIDGARLLDASGGLIHDFSMPVLVRNLFKDVCEWFY